MTEEEILEEEEWKAKEKLRRRRKQRKWERDQKRKGTWGYWERVEADDDDEEQQEDITEEEREKLAREEELEEVAAEYDEWKRECDVFFNALTQIAEGHQPRLLVRFPKPTHEPCGRFKCQMATELQVCQHDVERVLKGEPEYGMDFLRQERLRWHPDKFAKVNVQVQTMAKEMFQFVQNQYEAVKEAARAEADAVKPEAKEDQRRE